MGVGAVFGGKASFTQPIASICISLFTKKFANHNHSPAPVRVPCQYALVLPQRDGVWTTTSFTSAHTVALPCALQNIYCRQFQCTISPLVWVSSEGGERERKREREIERVVVKGVLGIEPKQVARTFTVNAGVFFMGVVSPF